MSIGSFLKFLSIFNVVRTNSSGAIEGQVAVRHDTLANLLAVTTASEGEIGLATDINALVAYTVVGGSSYGYPIYASGSPLSLEQESSPASYTANGNVAILANAADPKSAVDTVNDWLEVSADWFIPRGKDVLDLRAVFSLRTSFTILGGDAGATYTVKLQSSTNNGTSFANFSGSNEYNEPGEFIADGSGNVNEAKTGLFVSNGLVLASLTNLRLRFETDNTTAPAFTRLRSYLTVKLIDGS